MEKKILLAGVSGPSYINEMIVQSIEKEGHKVELVNINDTTLPEVRYRKPAPPPLPTISLAHFDSKKPKKDKSKLKRYSSYWNKKRT